MAARSLAELHGPVSAQGADLHDAPAIAPPAFGELGARVAAVEAMLTALVPRPPPDWVSGGHSASPRGAHPLTAYGTDVLRREASVAAAGAEAEAKLHRDACVLDVIGEELREAQHELRDARSRVDAPVTFGEAVLRPDVALGAGGLAGLAMQLVPSDSLTDRAKLARAIVLTGALGVGAFHYGRARVVTERRMTVDQLNRRVCDLRRERASYG